MVALGLLSATLATLIVPPDRFMCISAQQGERSGTSVRAALMPFQNLSVFLSGSLFELTKVN
jgi:hypothetical protein